MPFPGTVTGFRQLSNLTSATWALNATHLSVTVVHSAMTWYGVVQGIDNQSMDNQM